MVLKPSNKLKNYIDPLDSDSYPPGLVSVVTCLIVSGDVNVDNSVRIGSEQMHNYKTSWLQNYHSMVITMQAAKKNIKDTSVYGTKLISTLVMDLQQSQNLNIKDVLTYELSTVPASLCCECRQNFLWRRNSRYMC